MPGLTESSALSFRVTTRPSAWSCFFAPEKEPPTTRGTFAVGVGAGSRVEGIEEGIELGAAYVGVGDERASAAGFDGLPPLPAAPEATTAMKRTVVAALVTTFRLVERLDCQTNSGPTANQARAQLRTFAQAGQRRNRPHRRTARLVRAWPENGPWEAEPELIEELAGKPRERGVVGS